MLFRSDDGNACTLSGCDGAGTCDANHRIVTCDEPGVCEDDNVCNTNTGVCEPVYSAESTACDNEDGDACTTSGCDGAGTCDAEHIVEPCGEEICRTPGFWGARGGRAGDGYYNHGQDVTGAMLPLEVCGNMITNTDLGSSASAIEAICVKGGDPRAKMMRMLMSASLNCGLGDCSANTIALIEYCNDACFAEDSGAYSMCHSSLGCFNEGGHITDDGSCVPAGTSACTGSYTACEDDDDCNGLEGEECVSFESCHDRMACPDYYDDGEVNGSDDCFEPLGPASSPKKCNAARKNTPYIFDLPGWTDSP